MDVRLRVASLALVAACRDPNPYFDEPPAATTTLAPETSTLTAPTSDGTAIPGDTTTTSTTGTGGSNSNSATDTGTSEAPDTTASTGAFCMAGEIRCDGLVAETCDGNGGVLGSQDCDTLCEPGLGCVDCEPGTGQCLGDLAQTCSDLGTWESSQDCDPSQGLLCNPAAGACEGACAKDQLGNSHLGCDFYAVTLSSWHHENPPWNGVHVIVVVNANPLDANVSINQGDAQMPVIPVYAETTLAIPLTYVDALVQGGAEEQGTSTIVADGSYRVRSDLPITVYQYEPHAPQQSGDTSLLLPVHAWGTDHVVASYHHFSSFMMPGNYAVIASQDGTVVDVTASPTGDLVKPVGGIDQTGSGAVMLDAGDVLEVFTASKNMALDTDLTGTRVVSDKPVAVFGGHKCAEVPPGSFFCSHLEEQMPPVVTLGSKYVVAAPLGPDFNPLPTHVRVVATADDTNLTYDPAVPDPKVIAAAGGFVELTGFTGAISADKPVLVAQYISGVNDTMTGPAMVVAPPIAQFRDAYRVYVSEGFPYSGATVVAPTGTTVSLDGVPVEGWSTLGNSGHDVVRFDLFGASDGTYTLTGSAAFGVDLHGYDSLTSYWVPGGLGLQPQ